MTRKEMTIYIKECSQKSGKFTFVKSGYIDSPFISTFAKVNAHEYNASYFIEYELLANPKIHYVTVLSFYNDKYILKCSDSYLEGHISNETVKKLVNNSLERLPIESREGLKESMSKSLKCVERSSSCQFNQKNYEVFNGACEHISQFLKDLPLDVLDKLYSNYEQALHGGGVTSNNLDPKLNTLFNRYAFKKHLLLEGDKGSGKTYHATTWGKTKPIHQLFIGGHEQFESIDFLGHYIQKKSGELIWKDGALSEAFRRAYEGKRTLLIIDEMLRIPKRELNLLISALSPIDNNYVLRTGRALEAEGDIAVEEVLHVNVENLWVIGTTNMGAGYAVEAIDEALIDRFKPIRKDTSAFELRQILIRTATKRGFSMDVVQKLMDFFEKMKRLHKIEVLNKIVNIRHLNEALELASNELNVQVILNDSVLLWVERDYYGYPNEEQLSAIESVMLKVWKLYD